MRRGGELLAHVSPVNCGFQVVHDPVCRQPFDALVEVARHLELEVPLMMSGVNFVRLRALVWSGHREQRQGVDEEVCFLRNGLRADGVGQVPSVAGCQSAPCRSIQGVGRPYETLRVAVSVMRTLRTEIDSGLFSTNLPLSSASCDSEGSP